MDDETKLEIQRNKEALENDVIHYPEVAILSGWVVLVLCWGVAFIALPENLFFGDHDFTFYHASIQWFISGIFLSVTLAGFGKIVAAMKSTSR